MIIKSLLDIKSSYQISFNVYLIVIHLKAFNKKKEINLEKHKFK